MDKIKYATRCFVFAMDYNSYATTRRCEMPCKHARIYERENSESLNLNSRPPCGLSKLRVSTILNLHEFRWVLPRSYYEEFQLQRSICSSRHSLATAKTRAESCLVCLRLIPKGHL
jgi:hypothetical protein